MVVKQQANGEEARRFCNYCGEPVPVERGNEAECCSDECARDLVAYELNEKQEAQKEDLRQKRGLEVLKPALSEEREPEIPAMSAEQQGKDYWKVVKKKWVDRQCFIEVRKWDRADLDEWDGDPDDLNWIVVKPTRIWEPLRPVSLEHEVLNANPQGGHFQVRLYKTGVRQPALIANPFYFHYNSKYPDSGEGTDLRQIMPLLETERKERERERERLEKAKEKAEADLNAHMYRLMDQQEQMMRRSDDESRELRQQLMEKERQERDRQLAQQEMFFENQTRQFESMQSAQAQSMGQLTSQISRLFSSEGGRGPFGGGGEGGEAQVGVIATMMQMMLNQTQQQQEAQREQMRLDRQMQMKQMEVMATMLTGKPPAAENPQLKMLMDQNARLEERLYQSLEQRTQLAQSTPAAPQSKFEALMEKATLKQFERVLSGDDDREPVDPGPSLFDKALDVVDKVGLSRLTEAAARRIESPPPQEPMQLREAEATLPAAQLPEPMEGAPAMPQSQESFVSVAPSQVTGIENLLVAVSQAIEANMNPQDFASQLPKEARDQIGGFSAQMVIMAAKSTGAEVFQSPRARRWLEEAHATIKQLP